MAGSPASSGGGNVDVSSSPSQPKKNSKKPKYSRFTQQELPACKPILTPAWVSRLPVALFRLLGCFWFFELIEFLAYAGPFQVITAFVFVGVVFIPIGLVSLLASEHVVEIAERYDKVCIPADYKEDALGYIQNRSTNKTCTVTITVPKQMKSPVFVYYELDNFYQNHRRYVKSRSDKQLSSKSSESATSDCKPEDTTGNGAPIVPCGLIAWSLFNDTYVLSIQNKKLNISKNNIAWKSDQDHKFGSDVYPKNFQNGTLIGGGSLDPSVPLSEQVDLIVWMRTAALPTFRKLYGRIEEDLQANDVINVTIKNNYNTYSFGGEKKLVLSTTGWIGGKNDFLGKAYLTVGGLCLFLAVSFIVVYVIMPRPLGDPSYLSWNRNPGGLRN